MLVARPIVYELITLNKEPIALFLEVKKAQEFVRENHRFLQGRRFLRSQVDMLENAIKVRKTLYIGRLTVIEDDSYYKKTTYLVERSIEYLYSITNLHTKLRNLKSYSLVPYKAVYNPMKERWDIVKSEYTKEW